MNDRASQGVTIGVDIPPDDFDVIFVSVNPSGSPSHASGYVCLRLGLRHPDFKALSAKGHTTEEERRLHRFISDGFATIEHKNKRIIFISTAHEPNDLLGTIYKNIRQAFDFHFKDLMSARNIWMPLLAIDNGLLTPSAAAKLIAEILAEPNFIDPYLRSIIAISLPSETSERDYYDILDTFRKRRLYHDRSEEVSKYPNIDNLIESVEPTSSEDIKTQKPRRRTKSTAPNPAKPEETVDPSLAKTDIVAALQKIPNLTQKITNRTSEKNLRAEIETIYAERPDRWNGEYDEALLAALEQAAKRSEQAYFHADIPIEGADHDQLNRHFIAEAIAENITKIWPEQKTPYIVHVSGRWGSGKSSILNFLENTLKTDVRIHEDGWVVSNFNAWRQQGQGKSWWLLFNNVLHNARNQLGWRGRWLGVKNWWWRFFTGWKPWIIGLSFIVTAVMWFLFINAPESTSKSAAKTLDFMDSTTEVVSLITGLITSVITIVGLFSTFTRSSQKTSEALLELNVDPLKPVKRQYEKMIAFIDRPVAVFIDDLDRCDAGFVVELLQTLQTVYAKAPVLFVVAADGDWIVSSYEQKYEAFSGALKRPGQPLGALFLEKIVQLSVRVPELSPNDQKTFLESLVNDDAAPMLNNLTLNSHIDKEIETAQTEEDVKQAVEKYKGTSNESFAVQQGFKKLMDVEIEESIKHRLLDYVHLFDTNPRAIKRLVNAYSFKLGYSFLSHLTIDSDILIRWSILELRFPYTARKILEMPSLHEPGSDRDEDMKKEFFFDPVINDLLSPFTVEDIKAMRAIG